ncbi:MAG: sigma-70 family RNA polymerase sigma factor, partial [Christensenellales bacterium]
MAINKVEICGVDTGKLPRISYKKSTELLERIKSGDESARDEFIQANLRLVLSVIQRFSNRGEQPDDLFQVGCIGLLKAIANFRPELNLKFSTYGVPMIAGEVRRFLRDNASIRVSRSMRDTAYRVLQCKEKLMNEMEREPTMAEIASALDLPLQTVTAA